MLAMKKMIPTDPPNSGPRARLIMTGDERVKVLMFTELVDFQSLSSIHLAQ